jgi:hypothetical protein
MRKAEAEKCAGCGHRLDQHRPYANGGHNRHGYDRVCIVDNCQFWQECRRVTPADPAVPAEPPR